MAYPAALAFAALVAAGSHAAQAAETPASVFAAYGLTGSWSAACDRPTGPRNPRFHFDPQPDGLVDSVGDYGEDGATHAIVRDAFVDGEHRLHTTTYSTFDGLPKAMRAALGNNGATPGMTNHTISTMAADHGFATEDMVAEIEGAPGSLHLIAGGHVVSPATLAQGPPIPVRFKCPG